MMNIDNPLITTDELAAIIAEPDVKIVDASWWLDGRDAAADYVTQRIAGAVFFDIDANSDPDSSLPHMLPDAEVFARIAGQLGLSQTDLIVIYDQQGLFSAARVWWMFRLMGADRAVVLDGGLPKWITEGRQIESGPAPSPAPAVFVATPHTGAVADLAQVKAAIGTEAQILDARGAARFLAQVPEPREGVRSGHMPGALNLPFGELLQADKTLKSGEALAEAFARAGYDPSRPVITSCGSGVTAAILTLGLALMGKRARLYDGSWSEWGSRHDTPIEPA